MTGSRRYGGKDSTRALAAALALVLGTPALAQDGQFDLRTRSTPTPTPEPTVVGPSDPDNPTVRARPRAAPTEAAPPLVLPSAAPAATPSAAPLPQAVGPRSLPRDSGPVVRTTLSPSLPSAPTGTTPSTSASAEPSARPAAGPYQPRRLDVVAPSGLPGWWLALGALAALLGIGGWMAWSRHFRHRVRAVAEPEIERPQVAAPEPARPFLAEPAPTAPAGPALVLALTATRMSATLVNTTLTYRLSVTNRGGESLNDVVVSGDMIAAHASRAASDLLVGSGLPELHRIASLAPGETVTVAGDIRLPLVSITPIRRGAATFFVPLARMRARGVSAAGSPVEGGGTFLVGQEPGASKRLQPFRLDLGPRNYSRLSQQLLPAA